MAADGGVQAPTASFLRRACSLRCEDRSEGRDHLGADSDQLVSMKNGQLPEQAGAARSEAQEYLSSILLSACAAEHSACFELVHEPDGRVVRHAEPFGDVSDFWS
jgi:hypothetical protein